MNYLKDVETSLTQAIQTLNDYLKDDNAYKDMDLLSKIDGLLNRDYKEIAQLYNKLLNLNQDIKLKYDKDRAKYKNEVLYSKRFGKITIGREKERTYHKAEKGYKQRQHTHYKFAMEVATENGIVIHKGFKECVWRDKQTKDDNIQEIKNLLNREYFVDPNDVKVLEA